MSRKMLTVVAALALLAAGGWALAQQTDPPPTAPNPNDPLGAPPPAVVPPYPQPQAPQAPRSAPGRYTVAVSGPSGVLLDTATGKTWLLHRGSDGNSAWLPARRLDSDKEARQWLQAQKHHGAAAADREMALKREAVLQAERGAQQQTLQRAKAEAELQHALQQEREQALRALEQAQQRLRDLGLRQPPPK